MHQESQRNSVVSSLKKTSVGGLYREAVGGFVSEQLSQFRLKQTISNPSYLLMDMWPRGKKKQGGHVSRLGLEEHSLQ